MGKTEIVTFIVLTSIVIAVFFSAMFIFIMQYRRKKIEQYQKESEVQEEHKQALLSVELQIQQQTMQHIGREIHDSVGQKLTLASLYTKQLQGNDSKIAEIGSIIDESLTELRQLSKSLTNPGLAKLSLYNLLLEEASRVNTTGICYISIEQKEPAAEMPQSDKNILFRLLQEFIQNSLKHAGCRKINIGLGKKEGVLQVIASDDGKGFDTTIASTGIGLQNMKRRAAQINADYQLFSEPGKGTRLILQLPVEK